MLTLRQSPIALIGIFLTIGLADGEPDRAKLINALIMLVLTITYVLACIYANQRKYEHEEM